jgi:hypothetical protein
LLVGFCGTRENRTEAASGDFSTNLFDVNPTPGWAVLRADYGDGLGAGSISALYDSFDSGTGFAIYAELLAPAAAGGSAVPIIRRRRMA